MKIFLSWSGERSRMLAEHLREWLQDVVSVVEPWVSSQDIEKGARWASDLAKQLESTDIGIICLTPENTVEPWIMFEAGALAKALERARVCTYLIGLHPAALSGPLVQFQATQATKADTLRLLASINNHLGEHRLSSERLQRVFERSWPEMERAIQEIERLSVGLSAERTERDILEELVDLIRQQTRSHRQEILASQFDFLPLDNLFTGEDLRSVLDRAKANPTIGTKSDSNAANWESKHESVLSQASIDGPWSSRWNEKFSRSDWHTGEATIVSHGQYAFLLHTDPEFEYLMFLKWADKETLIGRHFNLSNLRDSSPWVGRVVDDARIDGVWASGRWDLSRHTVIPKS